MTPRPNLATLGPNLGTLGIMYHCFTDILTNFPLASILLKARDYFGGTTRLVVVCPCLSVVLLQRTSRCWWPLKPLISWDLPAFKELKRRSDKERQKEADDFWCRKVIFMCTHILAIFWHIKVLPLLPFVPTKQPVVPLHFDIIVALKFRCFCKTYGCKQHVKSWCPWPLKTSD